jgi:endonuclease YncB( thermonuclease family)
MSPEHEYRSVKKRFKALVIAIALVGLAAGWQAISSGQLKAPSLAAPIAENQPGLYRVTGVDDGDTIKVEQDGNNETVRLIGIDTPETKDPRKPVQCFGEAASRQTKAWLLGKAVRLEPDPLGDNRDKYNRLLRYVYLPDGTLINAQLIEQGYAFAYTIFPFEKLDQFRKLEAQARSDNRGLWSGCQINENSAIKQTNPQ